MKLKRIPFLRKQSLPAIVSIANACERSQSSAYQMFAVYASLPLEGV